MFNFLLSGWVVVYKKEMEDGQSLPFSSNFDNEREIVYILTHSTISLSMPSTSNPSCQISTFYKALSFSLVKGKALAPQVHIIGIALGHATLP